MQLCVTDVSGTGHAARVRLASAALHYEATLATDSQGVLRVEHMPFGTYRIDVAARDFATDTRTLEIRSSVPTTLPIRLRVAGASESVRVASETTLLDTVEPGSVAQIGPSLIEHRLSSIPGRSLQDLVNSQPGWLYEGNAVLHPRGSEYQTLFVLDGIPLTDNRSPSFGPEISADDVQSLSIVRTHVKLLAFQNSGRMFSFELPALQQ